jgi:hypothetical protein
MATGTHFREIITIISRPRERFRALVSRSFILTRALRNVKSNDTNGPRSSQFTRERIPKIGEVSFKANGEIDFFREEEFTQLSGAG